MNIKTTLGLLVAVTIVLGAVWWVDREGPQTGVESAGVVFPTFPPERAQRIILVDRTKERLTERVELERGTRLDEWTLSTQAIAKGQPVRAAFDVVRTLLGGLRDLASVRVHRSDPTTQQLQSDGLGPKERRELRIETEDGKAFDLWLGSVVDGANGIAMRRGDEGAVFVIDRNALDLLMPRVTSLEDAALLGLANPFEISRINVFAGGAKEPHLVVERDGDRWQMKHPVIALADPQRCDELRNTISGMRILGRSTDGPDSLPEGDRAWRVQVDRVLGEPLIVHFGQPDAAQRVPVSVEGRSGIVATSAAANKLFTRDPGDYRDRRVLPVLTDRIRNLKIAHDGVETTIRRRPSNFDVLREGWDRRRFLDKVATASLLDSLTRLQYASFDPQAMVDDPIYSLEVQYGARGMTEPITESFKVGPSNQPGLLTLTQAGQKGGGFVREDAIAFLGLPLEARLDRKLWGTDAYFRLAKLKLIGRRTAGTERSMTLTCQIRPSDAALVAELTECSIPGTEGRPLGTEFPDQMLRPIQGRLMDELNLDAWTSLADQAAAVNGLPMVEVHWFEATNATMKRIPEAVEGTWRKISIWPQGPDGICWGRYDSDLSLGFRLDSRDLLPFFEALDWAQG